MLSRPQRLLVPHSWFTHFYVFGFALSGAQRVFAASNAVHRLQMQACFCTAASASPEEATVNRVLC
jgi:hypothetical protein